ncbi:MAG: hypothetical protein KatS3mg131_1035 [Candidatus Tectimicrobiota bacterium]|nr:MAG: hypothetical protein KatS3mg131_1035 [Candidatus Tectomicrobia bacterium]
MRWPWKPKKQQARHKSLLSLPFIGQQALLTALEGHLQAAGSGQLRFVALSGEPGSGKTAALAEFVFRHCTTSKVLCAQLNAGAFFLPQEFYVYLFEALQRRSEAVLQAVYAQSKRLRKALATDWDEQEFRSVLASAEWHHAQQRLAGHQGSPLVRLLHLVRQHPWAVGAATILDVLTRERFARGGQIAEPQRWARLLQALQQRGAGEGASLVVLVDQVEAPAAAADWHLLWRTFAEATAEVGAQGPLPLFVLWAGTPAGIEVIREAVEGHLPLVEHAVTGLSQEDWQRLGRRVQRSLPRACQAVWQRQVAADAERHPARALLVATCLAALAETQTPPATALAEVCQAATTELVARLLDVVRQRAPAEAALLQQLLAACAFLPPESAFTLDDVLVWCDVEGAGLTLREGRARLEALLGLWVRYGLLTYHPHSATYTTSSSVVQEALRQQVSQELAVRHQLAWQRRLAAALLYHVQRDSGGVLAALAPALEQALPEQLLPPLRRLLQGKTQEERQRIATALGFLPSPVAVALLQELLGDEHERVRSRAAQSLANLQGVDTVSALLQALADPSSDVRWIAAHALGRIDSEATVEALIALLADEDKEVGRIAAEGLGRKGDRRAVPHLIAAMQDSYPLLRETAALALGQLADERAIPALQARLEDSSAQVRQSAARALARLRRSS